MGFEIERQEKVFWLAHEEGWIRGFGNSIWVGDYHFCAIVVGNKLNVSEVTTGTKIYSYNMSAFALVLTGTKDEFISYLYLIGANLEKMVSQRKSFAKELERMQQRVFNSHGPTPPVEEFWEFDEATGHLFCRYCGNNYMLEKHKEDCQSI